MWQNRVIYLLLLLLFFFFFYFNRSFLFQRQNIATGMDSRVELINTLYLYMRRGLRVRRKGPYKIRTQFVSLPRVQWFFFCFCFFSSFWGTNHLLFSFGSNIFSFLRHNLNIIKSTFLKNMLHQSFIAQNSVILTLPS